MSFLKRIILCRLLGRHSWIRVQGQISRREVGVVGRLCERCGRHERLYRGAGGDQWFKS